MMKKQYLILLIILIFSCTNSFASINLEKTTYTSNEIILFYLTTDDYEETELELFKNETKLNINPIKTQIEDEKFLIYFQARQIYGYGNFSLIYQNNFIQNFEIIPSNISLSLRPPYIKLSSKESFFKITLENMGLENLELKIKSENKHLMPARDTINLVPGEEKDLFVYYDYKKITENTFIELTYSDRKYKIPILIEKKDLEETIIEEEESIEKKEDYPNAIILVTEIEKIEHKVFSNQRIEGELTFKNVLNQELNNVIISFSPELAPIIDLEKYKFEKIYHNQEFTINLTINKFRNIEPGTYKGILSISCEEGCLTTLLFDLTFKQYEEISLDEEETIPEEEIQGDELEISPFNLTEPELPEEDSSNLKIAIFLMIIVLAGIIFITYKLKPKPLEPEFERMTKDLKKKK